MQHVPANAYQQSGPSLCKTSPAAVLYALNHAECSAIMHIID
ncbi:hypothetical protein [Enterobacter kobei]